MARGVSGPSFPFCCPFRIRAAVTVVTPIPEGAEQCQARVLRAGLWSPAALGTRAVEAEQALHLPSPKKRMRFLAAVWMCCSFLAASRAWAAWRFQKAGSCSSTGQGEREARSALGSSLCMRSGWEGPPYLG